MPDKQVIILDLIYCVVCKRSFSDAIMKIRVKDGVVSVLIKDKSSGRDFEECFKLEADLSYEKFFFVSATSGKALNNHHYIKSIHTYNLDAKVDSSVYENKH
jgi:hypothetical protein